MAEGHSTLDRKFEQLKNRLEVLDQKMDHGFATLGQRISFVEAAVLDVRKDIKHLDQRVEDLDHRMGGLEHRLDAHLAIHTA